MSGYGKMVGLVVGALSLSMPAMAQEVLGRIGSVELKTEEVRSSIIALKEPERKAVTSNADAFGKLVRSMLVQRQVLKEASAQNWEYRPEVIEMLKRARDVALTDSYLKSVSEPPADYPSEPELKIRYEAQKENLKIPRSYRLAQIYVSKPDEGDKAGEARAKSKLEKVQSLLKKQSADFALIARDHSEESQSAARGGEIGWLTEAQIQPEILSKLPKLTMNTVSEPVVLKDGWHILKVMDVREPFTPVLDQVRAQLTQQLRAERAESGLQAYLTKLLQDNPVVINEIAVEALLKKENSIAPPPTPESPR